MNAFATDIRALLTQRLAQASSSDVLALASALCANEDRITRPAMHVPRFTKIDLHGRNVSYSATDWAAVYDSTHDLTWTRKVLECGEVPWSDAVKAAGNMRLFGKTDWRAPTIQEQLSIIDYTRCDPAIDTTYFDGAHGWSWTSTPAASPSEYAWMVLLYVGHSGRFHQSDHGFVRAVRAGQPLALGL
jgi:uncharacterized protein DUF1566